jgi:hypothetical protein
LPSGGSHNLRPQPGNGLLRHNLSNLPHGRAGWFGYPQRPGVQSPPVCLEGARACPPEDVGGTWGYQEFLEAMADPGHERHEEFREWIGGRFDPEAFDLARVTKRMWRGLPDWRRMW